MTIYGVPGYGPPKDSGGGRGTLRDPVLLTIICGVFAVLAVALAVFLFSGDDDAVDAFAAGDIFVIGDTENVRTLVSDVISWKPSPNSRLNRVYFIRGKAGEDRMRVLAAVMPVEGVSGAYPSLYEVRVEIAECYSWSEVHYKVLEVLDKLVQEVKAEEMDKAEAVEAGAGAATPEEKTGPGKI